MPKLKLKILHAFSLHFEMKVINIIWRRQKLVHNFMIPICPLSSLVLALQKWIFKRCLQPHVKFEHLESFKSNLCTLMGQRRRRRYDMHSFQSCYWILLVPKNWDKYIFLEPSPWLVLVLPPCQSNSSIVMGNRLKLNCSFLSLFWIDLTSHICWTLSSKPSKIYSCRAVHQRAWHHCCTVHCTIIWPSSCQNAYNISCYPFIIQLMLVFINNEVVIAHKSNDESESEILN